MKSVSVTEIIVLLIRENLEVNLLGLRLIERTIPYKVLWIRDATK